MYGIMNNLIVEVIRLQEKRIMLCKKCDSKAHLCKKCAKRMKLINKLNRLITWKKRKEQTYVNIAIEKWKTKNYATYVKN